MRAENNIIALIIAMRNFVEGLNDIHHAMRTETVPLLALYLWRGGNLVQKSLVEI